MAVYYVTVGTAVPSVSTAFALGRIQSGVYIRTPSMASGGEVRVQTATSSGGVDYYLMTRPDGSGLPFAVSSGAGPAEGLAPLLHPWGRLTLTNSVTTISTFTLIDRL